MIVLRVDRDYYGSSQELTIKGEEVFSIAPKVPKQHRILAYDRFGSPTYMMSSEILPADLHIIERLA
jgi:hypothetical protein